MIQRQQLDGGNAELATLKRELEERFFDKKNSPGHPVKQFITEGDFSFRIHMMSLQIIKMRIKMLAKYQ